MFGLSFWEIAIILGIALIVLGPTKLPELAKSLGKGIREFRKATEDFKSTVDDEMHRPDPPPPPPAIPEPSEVAELLPPKAESETETEGAAATEAAAAAEETKEAVESNS